MIFISEWSLHLDLNLFLLCLITSWSHEFELQLSCYSSFHGTIHKGLHIQKALKAGLGRQIPKVHLGKIYTCISQFGCHGHMLLFSGRWSLTLQSSNYTFHVHIDTFAHVSVHKTVKYLWLLGLHDWISMCQLHVLVQYPLEFCPYWIILHLSIYVQSQKFSANTGSSVAESRVLQTGW